MKKVLTNLLVCLIILLVFAGALFFIGWTQFKVPSDGFGIIRSKTGGIKKELVLPGEFSWHWEFLIPTNAELHTFRLKNYQLSKKITGTLPSGEVYSTLNDGRADFSYSFDFSMTASISEEKITELFAAGEIFDQTSLDTYVEHEAESVARLITASILSLSEKNPLMMPETFTTEKLLSLADTETAVTLKSIVIHGAKFPDYSLYQKTREKYLYNLDEREERAELRSTARPDDDARTTDAPKAEAGTGTHASEESQSAATPEKTEITEEDIKLLNKLRALFS